MQVNILEARNRLSQLIKAAQAGEKVYNLLPVTETVFLLAAQLRARFGLKTPDALHLACAQYHRCDALWTNDDRLTLAGHGLAVNILR